MLIAILVLLVLMIMLQFYLIYLFIDSGIDTFNNSKDTHIGVPVKPVENKIIYMDAKHEKALQSDMEVEE